MGRISQEVFEILSFSTKYRRFTFLGILLFLFFIPVDTLEAGPRLSVCAALLKEHCYSVGITRGSASILQGDFTRGIAYNYLSIPVLILLFGIIIYDTVKHLKFKQSQKKMKMFDFWSKGTLIGAVIGLIIGIGLALWRESVWGIIIGIIAGAIIGSGLKTKREFKE